MLGALLVLLHQGLCFREFTLQLRPYAVLPSAVGGELGFELGNPDAKVIRFAGLAEGLVLRSVDLVHRTSRSVFRFRRQRLKPACP